MHYLLYTGTVSFAGLMGCQYLNRKSRMEFEQEELRQRAREIVKTEFEKFIKCQKLSQVERDQMLGGVERGTVQAIEGTTEPVKKTARAIEELGVSGGKVQFVLLFF